MTKTLIINTIKCLLNSSALHDKCIILSIATSYNNPFESVLFICFR